MGVCKQIGSLLVVSGKRALGGLLMLTAMGSAAFAGGVVPEIDAGSMCAAVTLLVGGALLLSAGREQN